METIIPLGQFRGALTTKEVRDGEIVLSRHINASNTLTAYLHTAGGVARLALVDDGLSGISLNEDDAKRLAAALANPLDL